MASSHSRNARLLVRGTHRRSFRGDLLSPAKHLFMAANPIVAPRSVTAREFPTAAGFQHAGHVAIIARAKIALAGGDQVALHRGLGLTEAVARCVKCSDQLGAVIER